MDSRLVLHEELCKILGSRNVYFNAPESVKMKYPAIRYSLNELNNRSASNAVYIQHPGYSVMLIDEDPDSPIAKKLSVLPGCRLSRPPYPANGLCHYPFTLKTTNGNISDVLTEQYNRGYADSEEKYKDIIEQKERAYEEGHKAGYEDGQEPFTLMYSLYGAFEHITFPENYKLVLNVPNCLVFDRFLLQVKNLKEVKLISDNESAQVSFFQSFYYSGSITTLDLTEFKPLLKGFGLFLTGASGLTEVKGELDLSISTRNDGFSDMSELVEIRFKPSSIYYSINPKNSPKLSDTSIQSIIDGLADLTGGTAQTLSLHATVKAKLTDEQKAQVSSKNWDIV